MNRRFIRNSEEEEREIALHAKEDDSELPADFFENAVWESGGKPFTPPGKVGRPVKDNPKQSTTIRLDADIPAAFKAGGKGWQTRINNALREWLSEHGADTIGHTEGAKPLA